jgi:flagellar motor protein MotB
MTELERRAKLLDDSNRQLTSQLALSQQQIQLYKERADLMQKQLSDVSNQLQQSNMAASRMVPAPMAAMPAPTVTLPPPLMATIPAPIVNGSKSTAAESTRKSGARLTANVSAPIQNVQGSQGDSLRRLGYDVESTNGSIRLRVPADQLFQGGTAQPTPSAAGILDRIAEIVRTEYPRRRVAIEGHTDNAPLYGGTYTTSHQLASAQTSAIFEQWTRRNQLPASQLSTLAHGSNYPLQDNQTPAGRAVNRRVEIVIFEENY